MFFYTLLYRRTFSLHGYQFPIFRIRIIAKGIIEVIGINLKIHFISFLVLKSTLKYIISPTTENTNEVPKIGVK